MDGGKRRSEGRIVKEEKVPRSIGKGVYRSIDNE